jgi:plastocyanin
MFARAIARTSLVAMLAVSFGTAAAAKVVHVDMTKIAFQPKQVTAAAGDTVEWTNHDVVAHTATANDKTWEVMVLPGKTASRVVDAAGTISYFCRFHPNMRGEITVTP